MKTKGNIPAEIEPGLTRSAELRRSLEERRSELVANLHRRMRVVRAERGMNAVGGGLDDGEVSEGDMQEDIELALIQLRAETLSRINASITRLEAGVYGQCASCGEEIATSRLRALPFAVRCRECEEQDETEHRRARADQGRRRPFFVERSSDRDPALG
jgi:DnaK suppressor protein